MADDLKKVGVELVAEGAAAFTGAVGKAAASLNVFERAAKLATSATNALGEIVTGALRRIGELGVNALVRAGREVLQFGQRTLEAAAQGSELNKTLDTLGDRLLGIIRFQIDPLLNQFNNLVEKSRPQIEGWVAFLAKTFNNLGQNALTWGENIAGQLAQGIYDGAQAVLDALIYIGSLITSWLMPGSPPKLLPDLDDWGKEAANVYLQGWTKADFSIFQTIGGEIESLLRSQAGRNDTGLIPRILGTREAIAQAVAQARQFGQVSADALNKIYQAAGAVTPLVQDYLKSVFNLDLANVNLKTAQDELNAATEKYQNLLKPLDSQLSKISEAQQQFSEEQEKSRLALILKDPNATAAEKEQARLRLQQIDAERARRALLEEQKVAVDAAQTKVDNAQKEVDAAQTAYDTNKAALDLQIEQNRLIQEQESLLNRLAAAIGNVAKAASGGGRGGVSPIKTAFELPKEIQEKIDALVAKLKVLQETWNTTLETVKTYFKPFTDFLKEQWERSTLTIFENIQGGLDELKKWWDKHHAEVKAALLVAFQVLTTTATVSLTLLSGAFRAGMQIINGDWEGAWNTTKSTFRSIMDQILAIVDTDWPTFEQTWKTNLANLKIIIQAGVDSIVAIFQPIIDTWNNFIATVNAFPLIPPPPVYGPPAPVYGPPVPPVVSPPGRPTPGPVTPLNGNVVNNYNYNPTYQGNPVAPQLDFAAMNVWSTP